MELLQVVGEASFLLVEVDLVEVDLVEVDLEEVDLKEVDLEEVASFSQFLVGVVAFLLAQEVVLEEVASLS